LIGRKDQVAAIFILSFSLVGNKMVKCGLMTIISV